MRGVLFQPLPDLEIPVAGSIDKILYLPAFITDSAFCYAAVYVSHCHLAVERNRRGKVRNSSVVTAGIVVYHSAIEIGDSLEMFFSKLDNF